MMISVSMYGSFFQSLSLCHQSVLWVHHYFPHPIDNGLDYVIVLVILIFVGRLFFKEALTWKKLAGAAICLVGIALINSK